MTRFAVFEFSMNKPDWYYNYFLGKLKKYKESGITFDLYDQIEDFDSISKYTLCWMILAYLAGFPLYKLLCFIRKIIY